MMRLKTTTSNAVRILVECAHAGDDRVIAADLADRLDLSEKNVLKIVYLLSRAGFLNNTRGRHGGVALARPPQEISVGDVVRKIEADSSQRASPSVQNFDTLIDDALTAFLEVLDRQSLHDLLDKRKVRSHAKRRATSKAKPKSRARHQTPRRAAPRL